MTMQRCANTTASREVGLLVGSGHKGEGEGRGGEGRGGREGREEGRHRRTLKSTPITGHLLIVHTFMLGTERGNAHTHTG